MSLHSVVAQITFDTEEPPNIDGIADMLANWEGVRRVRVRPAGMPQAAPTLRTTANSRFRDLYTEDQFLAHEQEVAERERTNQIDLTPAELNIAGVAGGIPTPAAPASGGQLPEDAKPSRSKRA